MNWKLLAAIIILFCGGISPTLAQSEATYIYGTVTDEEKEPILGLNITYLFNGNTLGTVTDNEGKYQLTLPPDQAITVLFKGFNVQSYERTFTLNEGEQVLIDVVLKNTTEELKTFQVEGESAASSTIQNIPVKELEYIPTTTMNIEDVLKTQAGVVTNNELSSQYSVRGGNFDENLVYVNEYEIFRPFLIRSGQQEGLSFINPNMVSSLGFSAGGFAAKYGDKMSSVLDVKYKRPEKFGGSIEASLLGASAHLEGVTFGKRLGYLMGVRHKSNAYLLNSLPTTGNYQPSFTDFQAFFDYQITPNITWDFIGNFARNRFNFVPTYSESNVGSFNQSLKLRVAYDGNEEDSYQSMLGGTGLTFRPDNSSLRLKLMTSAFRTEEQEAFSIEGFYLLNEVETSLSEDADLGGATVLLGAGGNHDWARNRLNATVYNIAHRGNWSTKKKNPKKGPDFANEHLLSWGLKFQHEEIVDQLNEWTRVDSADYTLPLNLEQIQVTDKLKTTLNISSNRYTGFIQDEWTMGVEKQININLGTRFQYWDLNDEFLVSPRVQFSFRPLKFIERANQDEKLKAILAKEGSRAVERDLLFRFAAGAYYQPAFYREMRNFEGTLNTDLKAQKSLHAVLGMEYNFNIWNRPFKLTTEAYYKHLWDLVPYDIDNLLIRYFGENLSSGFATGIDLRLNGEFIPDTESWISLSILRTKEDLENDFYYEYFNEAGENIYAEGVSDFKITDSLQVDIPARFRATDQLVTFGMFFQDYIPNNKNFKTHLSLLFGSGLPYGPPGNVRWRNTFRMNPYRRVDIGFSALLFDRERKKNLHPTSPFRYLDNVWFSLEVFNLLDIQNTVSYDYFRAYSSDFRRQLIYNIPQFLTGIRVNARLKVKF